MYNERDLNPGHTIASSSALIASAPCESAIPSSCIDLERRQAFVFGEIVGSTLKCGVKKVARGPCGQVQPRLPNYDSLQAVNRHKKMRLARINITARCLSF